jgi:hypothetical protein
MWGRPRPHKHLGTDRQARVTTLVVVLLLALGVFFLVTLVAAAF